MEAHSLPPRLSSSVSSASDSSSSSNLGTTHIDPDVFQAPCHHRPMYSIPLKPDVAPSNLPSSSPPSSRSSPPSSPPVLPSSLPLPPSSPLAVAGDLKLLTPKQRTQQAHMRMRSKFKPYKLSAPPLELWFAMRTFGRSSHTDIRLEDALTVMSLYRCSKTYK